MGYKLFAIQNTMTKENVPVQSEKNELVLLTGAALGSSHFAAKMLDEMFCVLPGWKKKTDWGKVGTTGEV